jgi:cytoplasmic iron level regulating protein YaaA (DUF328/UPF0246 family)
MATSSPKERELSRDFLVLLPPSEGKAVGGEQAPWAPDHGIFGPALESARLEIISALANCHGGSATMLGVKGAHLDRAQTANLTVLGAATLPAWQRYTGVVWDHLNPATLTESQRSRILIASGFGGIFAASDPVPDYRLKMGASVPGIGPVARLWRERLEATLTDIAQRVTLIDLLAQEQRKALPPELPVLEVTLRTRAGALGGHAAKAAKGLLARHLVTLPAKQTQPKILAALEAWDHPDFYVEITTR